MSAFSFSHFYSCYLCLTFVLALFHLCSSNQNLEDVLCIKKEKQALLQFKHRLVDEGGRLASWVGEQNDCCKWAGIVCDNKTGHVHQIHLRALDGHCQFDEYKEEEASKQKLKGDLSPSLLDLKQLEHLDLSCNDFGWIQVPEFIGSLGNLRYLNLSSSYFGGTIPPQLGNLSELHTLCLGSFQDDEYGSERTSVVNMEWLSNLRLLRHLDMSTVNLSKATDWFQVINTLPSLAELHLKRSHLLDAHPHVPTLNITSLFLLDLSWNQYFTSSLVPQLIFSITSLVSLDLSGCWFSSSSAHSFGNLTSLKSLHVFTNTFMNSSLVLKELSSGTGSNLISLDISGCHISSTALDSLHNLTSLLSNLISLDINGSLPNSLGQLSKLEELDFFSNFLTGVVTETHFVKLVRLKVIDGRGNNLILRPRIANWIPPFQLKMLYLNSWSLGPQFPLWLQSQRDLEDLDISNTNISSPIPESFWRSFPNLLILDMSKNQMQGMVNLSGFPVLTTLDLSCNRFGGKLPDILNGSFPGFLDLSNNLFVGSLHHLLCSDGAKATYWLNLRNNILSGVIPECWEKWQSLSNLNMENNIFFWWDSKNIGSCA